MKPHVQENKGFYPFIIIKLIQAQIVKYSYMSKFLHQPGDVFRTDLLWHSTAADDLLYELN